MEDKFVVKNLTTTQIYNIDASYRSVMEKNNTKVMEKDCFFYIKKSFITNTMMLQKFTFVKQPVSCNQYHA